VAANVPTWALSTPEQQAAILAPKQGPSIYAYAPKTAAGGGENLGDLARENRFQQYLYQQGLPGGSTPERQWYAAALAAKLTEISKRHQAMLGSPVKLNQEKLQPKNRPLGGFGDGGQYSRGGWGGGGGASTAYGGNGLINWRIGF
jgi:hypothetical protein